MGSRLKHLTFISSNSLAAIQRSADFGNWSRISATPFVLEVTLAVLPDVFLIPFSPLIRSLPLTFSSLELCHTCRSSHSLHSIDGNDGSRLDDRRLGPVGHQLSQKRNQTKGSET